MVASKVCKKHILTRQKFTDVFFVVYFCLLIIITIAIIKANAMIVTDTRPAKSKYAIHNNPWSSIIRLTSSFVWGKSHLLILISLKNSLAHCSNKIKRTKCEIFYIIKQGQLRIRKTTLVAAWVFSQVNFLQPQYINRHSVCSLQFELYDLLHINLQRWNFLSTNSIITSFT